jgi:ribosomal protein S21
MAKELDKKAVDQQTPEVADAVPQDVEAPVEGQQDQPTPDEEPTEPTAKERYRNRYQKAHPDLDLDDEDSFYSQANNNLDELEGFRKNNEEIGKAIDANPLLAGMVVAAREGTNPWVYLARNGGLDARKLADNDEFNDSMEKALTEFNDNMESNKRMSEARDKNFAESISALKSIAEKRGLSMDEAKSNYESFFKMVEDAENGKVAKETWDAWFNSKNYDADVKSAADKARTQALNEKFRNKVKIPERNLPPDVGGDQGGREPKKKKSTSFADFGME